MHGHTAAHTHDVCSPLSRIVSREAEDFFFLFFHLAAEGEKTVFDVGLRRSTLSGVLASDAPSRGVLGLHNGSRLIVQARLSTIYIYIKATICMSCTAAEERKLQSCWALLFIITLLSHSSLLYHCLL